MARIDGPVLDLPGPPVEAPPPGQPDPSRTFNRYLLGAQVHHGQPSPWVQPFNHVGVPLRHSHLAAWAELRPEPADLEALATLGITWIVLHPEALGTGRADRILAHLAGLGLEFDEATDGHFLAKIKVPPGVSGP